MLHLFIFKKLIKYYGPQNWWPIDLEYHKKFKTDWRVEVIVGAILTQNTKWEIVEKAIKKFKSLNYPFSPEFFVNSENYILEDVFRNIPFYRIKINRIKSFFSYLLEKYNGNLDLLFTKPLQELRNELLSIKGIGNETADVIILYAAEKPTFVVDKYSRRLFSRLGIINGNEKYDEIKYLVEKDVKNKIKNYSSQLKFFKEYHALIDIHCKTLCKNYPICKNCPLVKICNFGKNKITMETNL